MHAAVKPSKPAKLLTLSKAVAKYRALSDQQLIPRLVKLLQTAPATDARGKPRPALQDSTLGEYRKTLLLLAERLSERWTGQPRQCLPSLIELLLRPTGLAFVAQILTDPAEIRRVGITLSSVVSRCFAGILEEGDSGRALAAWRQLLSQARRSYFQARKHNGGFGGWVDEEALVSAEDLRTKIDALSVGPARLCLSLLRLLVLHFPKSCQVQSRCLNLGHVRLVKAAGAPSLAAWAAEVVADDNREAGLLLIGEESLCLYLLLDATGNGPVACKYNLSPGPAAEVHAYLQMLPPDQPWLIAHAKGGPTKPSAPYSGAAGREAFNSRLNRMLQKVFGTEAVMQTIFRLSILKSHAISQGPQL